MSEVPAPKLTPNEAQYLLQHARKAPLANFDEAQAVSQLLAKFAIFHGIANLPEKKKAPKATSAKPSK